MSSVDVSRRTKIAGSPRAAVSFACAVEKQTRPQATPGEADGFGRFRRRLGKARRAGLFEVDSAMREALPSRSIRPSSTRSTAIFSAARGVRLAARVCRKNSRPRSTVNSMSCTSRQSASSARAPSSNWRPTSGMRRLEQRRVGGRAPTRYDVLALRVGEEIDVELLGAGRRIARKCDARARIARPNCRRPSPGR